MSDHARMGLQPVEVTATPAVAQAARGIKVHHNPKAALHVAMEGVLLDIAAPQQMTSAHRSVGDRR